jgi:transcriptional regulator with XRE-family HTH domain
MEKKRFSLSETARRFGVSKGYLSRRVHASKAAKGHHLYRYALFSEDETIQGFEIPVSMLPEDSDGSQAEETGKRERNGGNVSGNVSSVSPDESSDERENPAGQSVAAGVMGGAVSEIAREVVKGMSSPLREAEDASEAVEVGGRMKDGFLEVAPFLAGAAWAWTHRDSPDVSQLGGAVVAAAVVDTLVHGQESIFLQWAAPDASGPEDQGSGMEGVREEQAETVAETFLDHAAGGDGAALGHVAETENGDSQ